LGVSFYSIAQALLPADSPGNRTPPPGWRAGLAKLARKRGGRLTKLAEELERST